MNIDICRASKDVLNKDINLLVPNAEKQEQSGKCRRTVQENSAANDLGICEKINKQKMSEEESGPDISRKLVEVAMKYWSEESKNPVVVNKTLEGLKIHANCSGVRMLILNEAVAKNRKFSFYEKADKRLSDLQKGLVFAKSAGHINRYQKNVKNVYSLS